MAKYLNLTFDADQVPPGTVISSRIISRRAANAWARQSGVVPVAYDIHTGSFFSPEEYAARCKAIRLEAGDEIVESRLTNGHVDFWFIKIIPKGDGE